jgi:hypothetical protein
MAPPNPTAGSAHDPLFGAGGAAAHQAVEPVFQPQFDGDDRTDDHPPSFSSDHAGDGASPRPEAVRKAEDSPLPDERTDAGALDDDAPSPLVRGPATPLPPKVPAPSAAQAPGKLGPYALVAALIALTLLTAWWSSRP